MDMPETVKADIENLEKIIKEINFRYQEQARRDCEPYIKAITSMRSLYPQPFFVPTFLLRSTRDE